jgi:hypothetical protein
LFRSKSFYSLPSLLIFFGFFPYVTLYSFGTDIQPWYLLCLMILFLLIINVNKVNNLIAPLLIVPVIAFMLLLLSGDYLTFIRSIAGYITIALTPIVFLYILTYKYPFFVAILKLAVVVYSIVGLIQLFIFPEFFEFLMPRFSTSVTRGVVSLAVEPANYGLVCLFMILIFNTLDIKNKNIYILALLFQILFLSQSSMVILFLMIFSILFSILFLFKFSRNMPLLTVFLILFFIFLSYIELGNYSIRSITIAKLFIESPLELLALDQSINDRVSAIYFSFKGFFDNYLMPNGFGTYSNFLTNEVSQQDTFIWTTYSNRIMSYYGSILYELGIFGLIIPVVYSWIIYMRFKYSLKRVIIYLVFINGILLSAIPLTFPFVGIYMAVLLYTANFKFKKNRIIGQKGEAYCF